MDGHNTTPATRPRALTGTPSNWSLVYRGLALLLLALLCCQYGFDWTPALLVVPALVGARRFTAVLTLWLSLWVLLDPRTAWPNIWFGGVLLLTIIMAYRRTLVDPAGTDPAGLVAPRTTPSFALVTLETVLVAVTLLFRNIPTLTLVLLTLALIIMACALGRRRKFQLRRNAVNALLLVTALAVSLAICEVVVRVRYGPALRVNPAFHMAHRPVGFTLRPNGHGSITIPLSPKLDGPHRRINIHISSQGLRDRPVGPPRPGETRIIVLGDSFAFGWGLQENQTISRTLERMLRRHLPNQAITVLNGGVDNYGPWQERVFLQERCLPLRPALVLHELFPANDIQDSLTKIGKYLRAYDRPAVQWYLLQKYHAYFPIKAERWARQHCMTYKLAVRACHLDEPLATLLWQCRFTASKPYTAPPDSEPHPFSLEVCLRHWYPTITEGWNHFQTDVLNIRDLCALKHVAYAAFVIPEPCDVIESSWQWATEDLGPPAYERFKDVRITKDFCHRNQIPYIPAAAALKQSPTPDKLYYRYDGHLTPQGAKLVARALARYVLDQYFHRAAEPNPKLPAAQTQPPSPLPKTPTH